jgi:arsenate reductase
MRRSVRSLTSAIEPVLWHNQNCSKSRAALALLEEHGAPFQVRPYLDDAPTFAELKTLERQLNLAPIEWARTADNAWVEHFDGVTVFDDILPDDDDILRAMAAQPIMIERPILAVGDRACVGRPPERILSLLGGTGDEEEIEGGVAAAPSASSEGRQAVAAALSDLDSAAAAALVNGASAQTLDAVLRRTIAEIRSTPHHQ